MSTKYKLEGEWIDPDKIDELSNEDLDEMIDDEKVLGEVAENERFLKDLFGMGGEEE